MKKLLLINLVLLVILGVVNGCATKLDRVATALTPPKDPGIVDLDMSGQGIVIKYHRDTRSVTNAGNFVTIIPETKFRIQQ